MVLLLIFIEPFGRHVGDDFWRIVGVSAATATAVIPGVPPTPRFKDLGLLDIVFDPLAAAEVAARRITQLQDSKPIHTIPKEI